MARVGKSRVLGSSALVYLSTSSTTKCLVGEVDKFSAKELSEIKKSRPLGKKQHASQADFQGWEMSFEGGKVDANQAALFQAITTQFLNGGRTPYFEVTQKITFYDGSEETYTYNDVTLYDFNVDVNGSGDEVMEKFTGFAASRTAADDVTKSVVAFQGTVVDTALGLMTSQKPGGPGGDGLRNVIDAALGFLDEEVS